MCINMYTYIFRKLESEMGGGAASGGRCERGLGKMMKMERKKE